MAMKKKEMGSDRGAKAKAVAAKNKTVKGFVSDPYGYTSGKNMNKGVTESAKSAVESAKKKYGTNFVVDVSMDGVVRTTPKYKNGGNDLAGRSSKTTQEEGGIAYSATGKPLGKFVSRTEQRKRDQAKRAKEKKKTKPLYKNK
jgi:hypothetical protein